MKIEIKHRLSGEILFSIETDSWRLAVEAAVKANADLRYANLRSANLSYADLRSANLSYADLRSANLSYADLRYANLSSADLRYANLRYANLRYANLSYADLKAIKKDFLSVLDIAKDEALGLYDALMRGKINGSSYEGDCACLVGTIAHCRNEQYDKLKIPLKPDQERASERWFLAIREGDIPQNNPVSAVTAEWMQEWFKKHKIKYPKYEIMKVL